MDNRTMEQQLKQEVYQRDIEIIELHRQLTEQDIKILRLEAKINGTQ